MKESGGNWNDLELIIGLSLLAGSGLSPHRSRLGVAVREAFHAGQTVFLDRLAAIWGQEPSALRVKLAAVRPDALAAIDRGKRVGLSRIAWGAPEYPERLTSIHDPPPVIWYRGDPSRLHGLNVALVRARRPVTPAKWLKGLPKASPDAASRS